MKNIGAGMRKSKSYLILTMFLLLMPAGYAMAEDLRIAEDAGQTISATSDIKPAPPLDNEKMEEEKDNEHERGMHDMIHGDHDTGWGMVIGAAMIVMMVVMIL